MPRARRKKGESAIYHALLRGINQQSIFEENEDFEQFLVFLAKVKEVSKFELYAFCLMDNHVHLLLKEKAETLSQIFRRLGARYVFWFNWKYQRNGHLFQDRFKSEPVETDAYFSAVLRYIHLNPVKAGLCETPDSYAWSSLRLSAQKNALIDWDALENIVSLFEFNNPNGAAFEREPLETTSGRRQAIADKDARGLMEHLIGAKSVADFQALPKPAQKEIITKLRRSGVSVRQLARITGLSKGTAERWSKE